MEISEKELDRLIKIALLKNGLDENSRKGLVGAVKFAIQRNNPSTKKIACIVIQKEIERYLLTDF